MENLWSMTSWKNFPSVQQPNYSCKNKLNEVCEALQSYPPLVFSGEVERLKSHIKEASLGQKFLLQGGDCAERFKDCNEASIVAKLKILLQMSTILSYGIRKPVIRIGRIAGQYAKPRSNDFEVVNGEKIPVFRGDNVNSINGTKEARIPDPRRLLEGYHRSAMSLNYIRALTTGGFADLHKADCWDLIDFKGSQQCERYSLLSKKIKDAIDFFESLRNEQQDFLRSVEFFTSHEGLILPYESSMTRLNTSGSSYNLGAHMLWIGDRTRQLEGAHVEYFRGIANPIGIKVGPSAEPAEIADVVAKLNPINEPGKIVLISRFGKSEVQKALPKLIDEIQKRDLSVCWSADPMHGNTVKTSTGIKTRDFNAICSELKDTFEIHKKCGSILGGVHFELTGESVTECVGGVEGITDLDLKRSYKTYCDPRLNYSQSLEMAFQISEMMTS